MSLADAGDGAAVTTAVGAAPPVSMAVCRYHRCAAQLRWSTCTGSGCQRAAAVRALLVFCGRSQRCCRLSLLLTALCVFQLLLLLLLLRVMGDVASAAVTAAAVVVAAAVVDAAVVVAAAVVVTAAVTAAAGALSVSLSVSLSLPLSLCLSLSLSPSLLFSWRLFGNSKNGPRPWRLGGWAVGRRSALGGVSPPPPTHTPVARASASPSPSPAFLLLRACRVVRLRRPRPVSSPPLLAPATTLATMRADARIGPRRPDATALVVIHSHAR